MKRVSIAMLVLLIVSLSLIQVFAQPPGYGPPGYGPPGYGPPGYGPPREEQDERAKRRRERDRDETADANAVADPNKDISKIFEGQLQALSRFNQQNQKETKEWGRTNVNKRNLARAVNAQATAELNLLRELAVEEGAVKTIAGIDALLAERQKRFEETSQQIEDAKKREREQGREGRKDRDRGRDRGRSRDRTREPRSRSRQGSRRTTGPPM